MQPWKLDFSQIRLWPGVVALATNFGVYLSMLAATAVAGMFPLWGLLPAVLCGIGMMILPRVGERVAPCLHRWPKVAQGVLVVSRTLSFAVVARIVAFSWLGWGVEVVILLLAFAAFSLPVSIASAVLVVVGINVAIPIPGLPAQVGTFEAGVAGALLMRGITGPTALAFALSYHALMAVPVYAAGALVVLFRARESFPTN